MKKTPGITEIKNRTSFPKRMLRKFVNNQLINKVWKEKANKEGLRFSNNYEPVHFCSIHLPISGKLDLLFDAKHPESISRISIPVQSTFIVTCTQEKMENYKMTWSCSMS
jgi:hypothetical protein